MADYDLAVVGGGSAGYHAARVASNQGKSVALIEGAERFGGLCILRGCTPTKTMLRSAEIAQLVRESSELGIETSAPVINWPRIVQRTADLVTEFADYRHDSARGLEHVDIIRDWATFDSPDTIRLSDRTLTADHYVIATGSAPRTPGTESGAHPPGLEETGYLTSDDIPLLPELPDSLIVFGGGAVALEFAQLFCRLGIKVTVIQRSPLILSNMDADIAVALTRYLGAEGVTFVTDTWLEKVEAKDGLKTCTVHVDGRVESYSAQEILLAVGRRPAVTGLNCDVAGIECTDGWVDVDDRMRTSNPRVFAGGDVVGGPAVGAHQLVHVAVRHGEIIGHNAFNESQLSFDRRLVPEAVFTDPAIGIVGLTDQQAAQSERPILTAIESFEEQGKALTMGQAKGLVKMIADAESGEILGVHILGPEGADLIHEAIVLMHFRATVHDLASIPHLHPTLAEIMIDPAEAIIDQMN